MNLRGHYAEQPLSTSAADDPGRPATGSPISRRALFRYGSGTAVVAGVGLAGLLELLENREAIAAGTVIEIGLQGITREPDEPGEIPHRHAFSVRFRVTSVSPSEIRGDVSGRAGRVISTGSEREEQHFHLIRGTDVALEDLILSDTENNEPNAHSHQLSLE
jgi:hypothetical protein